MKKFLFLAVFSCSCLWAEELVENKKEEPKKEAPMEENISIPLRTSFLEINMGSFLERRLRFSYEYLVGSGIGLGNSFECEYFSKTHYSKKGCQLGVSFSYYFQKTQLQGFYGALEMSSSWSYLTLPQEKGWTVALDVIGTMGYRFVPFERVTSAFGLGARRTVLDFFKNKPQDISRQWENYREAWNPYFIWSMGFYF